ncbi:iron-containing alcohol dehydrogenase [Lishizhenia sp.]|uniref:iron-containing alcohol dehydrogenase n=1 Tax=Lishizhenia sp. TaxID=2497594 RepID=UPI00299D5C79|nr:iron-containing alcohol dehydrogenase [Lishizhenia sp.]MDX1446355.1 iron-containing alcohol dehydrogenase [Lishizhenia sp.]
MNNFDYYNPTKVVFGKDTYERIASEIALHTSGKNILITYGGGSIKANGVYDSVMAALKDFNVLEFGGIEPNPQYATCMKAIELIKENEVDFVLAVGGGSVIDGTKFIAAGATYAGDPWDVLMRKEGCAFTDSIPFGTVLTLPATGSEMNSGAVISREELKEKRTMGGPQSFPKFSFLDPSVVATLPKRQIANGITDAFMHTLEQYLTYPTDNKLQERIAEGILMTLIETAPKVMEDPSNYEHAANLMWCATMALNGTLRAGVAYDWATHMIGHELTALHGIDHARTLAIIAPRLFEVKFENKKEKLAQYGERVWGATDNKAQDAIVKTKLFFESLGIDTTISAYDTNNADTPKIIRQRFEERGWTGLGERGDLTPEEAEKIVEMAL